MGDDTDVLFILLDSSIVPYGESLNQICAPSLFLCVFALNNFNGKRCFVALDFHSNYLFYRRNLTFAAFFSGFFYIMFGLMKRVRLCEDLRVMNDPKEEKR